MTVERENRWLKVIVVVMFVAGVLGIVAHQHVRNATIDAMEQQVRLWQVRCGPQQHASESPPVLAAALLE